MRSRGEQIMMMGLMLGAFGGGTHMPEKHTPSKSPLNPKQKKARNKSKAARKARKR